jgi:hypothetical protein
MQRYEMRKKGEDHQKRKGNNSQPQDQVANPSVKPASPTADTSARFAISQRLVSPLDIPGGFLKKVRGPAYQVETSSVHSKGHCGVRESACGKRRMQRQISGDPRRGCVDQLRLGV